MHCNPLTFLDLSEDTAGSSRNDDASSSNRPALSSLQFCLMVPVHPFSLILSAGAAPAELVLLTLMRWMAGGAHAAVASSAPLCTVVAVGVHPRYQQELSRFSSGRPACRLCCPSTNAGAVTRGAQNSALPNDRTLPTQVALQAEAIAKELAQSEDSEDGNATLAVNVHARLLL